MQRIRSSYAVPVIAAVAALFAGAVVSAQEPVEASPGEVLMEAPAPADGGGGANPQAAAENLDAYTIQPGDTLWDICARLLGDPFYWPKLWSLNQYISNPHWIYPGNLLVFREGSETAPPQFEVTKPDPGMVEAVPTPAVAETVAMTEVQPVEPQPVAVPVQPVTAETLQEGFQIPPEEAPVRQVAYVDPYAIKPLAPLVDSNEIVLRQEGFIAEAQIPPLGHVYKSEEERDNLAEGDEVYLKLNDPSQAQVGKRFTVYRTLRRVKHPLTKGYMGFLVKILAEMEVVSVNGDIANAKVKTSYDYINRGDPITDYVSVLKRVTLQPNTAALEGVIVDTMVEGLTIMGDGDVIYLDKGTADGLAIGNTVDVVRSGDGLFLVGQDGDRQLPQEVVGRLVIVGARERTATAVIVDAIDALAIGDKIRVAPN